MNTTLAESGYVSCFRCDLFRVFPSPSLDNIEAARRCVNEHATTCARPYLHVDGQDG